MMDASPDDIAKSNAANGTLPDAAPEALSGDAAIIDAILRDEAAGRSHAAENNHAGENHAGEGSGTHGKQVPPRIAEVRLRGQLPRVNGKRLREQPWHRYAYELRIQGKNYDEIAAATGKTVQAVRDILHNEHYLDSMALDIHERATVDQRVHDVIEDSVVESVELLAAQVRDEKLQAKDRRAAAVELLERRYGKAASAITTNTVDLNNLPDSELVKHLTQN